MFYSAGAPKEDRCFYFARRCQKFGKSKNRNKNTCCWEWLWVLQSHSRSKDVWGLFTVSQSSVGFVSSSSDCLFVFFWAPARTTHPLRSSLLQRDLGIFFPSSFQRHSYRLSASLTASISRRYGRNNKANPNCGAQISLIPGWHSAKIPPELHGNTILRANLTKKVQQRYFIQNAGLLHHASFPLLSFLSSRLWFIKLTVTQCALSSATIPIYSPRHHTLSATSHQPSAHYPSHRQMLGQY